MPNNPPPIIPLPLGQRIIIIAALFGVLILVGLIRGSAPALKKGYDRYAASNR